MGIQIKCKLTRYKKNTKHYMLKQRVKVNYYQIYQVPN